MVGFPLYAMIVYSAAEAISPAIARTREFLFKPFRMGRFLKFALVALLTEGGMASCNFGSNLPMGKAGEGGGTPGLPHLPPLPHMQWPALAVVIGVVAAVLLVVIPVMILIDYLLIRLRFSFFDCLLFRQDFIGPAWSKYHRQSMRYLGLSVCVSAAFWVVMGAAGYALYTHFQPLFEAISSDHPPTFYDFLPMIGTAILVLMICGLIFVLIQAMLRSFILPRLALEDAEVWDALSDMWHDFEAEPWQYVLFFFLRFLVCLAGSILGVIALVIPFVVAAAIIAVLALVLKGISAVAALAVCIPLGAVALALFFLGWIGLCGMIGTFRRSYALYFYGGRYDALGDLLQPVPQQVTSGLNVGPAQRW